LALRTGAQLPGLVRIVSLLGDPRQREQPVRGVQPQPAAPGDVEPVLGLGTGFPQLPAGAGELGTGSPSGAA
jgi:hypothetical protein